MPLALGAPTNNSDGTAVISSGPATAVGNSAQTGTGQSTASGNQVTSFLVGQQHQSAGVANAGSASANTGGNTAIGNGSNNRATTTQEVSGGLLGVGVNLGGPTNNSTGTAAINTGAANATGNSSDTTIGQTSQGGARSGGGVVGLSPQVAGSGGSGVGGAACSSGRPTSVQNVNIRNQGQAQANTGDNVAIGNGSTNNASSTVGQTVSGGLLGVGLTVGGPVNNSTGTAVINTGPASAVGNESTTQVGQVEGCPQVTTLTAGRQVVVVPTAQVRQGTLARTGLETSDLGMIAGGLLGLGMLLIASQRRRLAARSAAVPMAGLGFGLGDNDWDGAVR